MNYENDDHQSTEYLRPSTKHRCGRAARWGKPCWQGPDRNKKCGGQSECTPLARGDRFICQRPKSAGGACVEGPLPDGACAHTHIPCRPRDSIRLQRGKFALFGVLLIVALVTLFSNRDDSGLSNSMIKPDELSSLHAGYPVKDQCVNCHKSHDLSAGDWLMSAFSSHDMTEQCVQCHTFAGKPSAPHNKEFESTEDNVDVSCISCHREHKGKDFDISKVANQVCGNCHEKSFTDFSGHSDFSTDFPHQQPQKIFFDHAKHIGEYFVDEQWVNKPGRDPELAEKAKNECKVCHKVETAQRDIKIRDYQTICASCHEQQIKERVLTVLTADEISPALLDLLVSPEAREEDDWDIDDFTAELIELLAEDGMQAAYEIAQKSTDADMLRLHLFSGLESSLIKTTAKRWLNEEELDAEDGSSAGWFAAENDDGAEAVFYRAEGHADSIMRSWIEFYLEKTNTTDDESAEEVLTELLDVQSGAGACGKCHGTFAGQFMAGDSHTANGSTEDKSMADASQQNQASSLWGRTATQERLYTSGFSHRPHIDLLSSMQDCDVCHKLSDVADYPKYFKQGGVDAELFQSNFEGIKLESCTNCHNEERISDDCQMCHVYHTGARVAFESQKHEMKVMKP